MENATTVTTAMTDLFTVAGQALEFISDNPLLALCFAGCIAPVAFRVIKAARKSVTH